MLERKHVGYITKAASDDGTKGRVSGRASVYGVLDFHNDVVERGAFARWMERNGNRVPVLYQHDTAQPVGVAVLSDSRDALLADMELPLDIDDSRQAYLKAKHGVVTGISIGYETVTAKHVNGARHLTEINLFEISLVTMPANDAARVETVKNAGSDAEVLASLRRLSENIRDANRSMKGGSELDALRSVLNSMRDLKRSL